MQYSTEQNADGTWVLTYVADDAGTVWYRNVPTTLPGKPVTAAVNKTNWSLLHNITDRWKSITESTGACTSL